MKKDLVNAVAKKHKEMFFCEPTDKNINEVFELDGFNSNYVSPL